jgi:hypothetical protein
VFGTEISVFKNKPSYLHQDFGMMPLENQQNPTQHNSRVQNCKLLSETFSFFVGEVGTAV